MDFDRRSETLRSCRGSDVWLVVRERRLECSRCVMSQKVEELACECWSDAKI